MVTSLSGALTYPLVSVRPFPRAFPITMTCSPYFTGSEHISANARPVFSIFITAISRLSSPYIYFAGSVSPENSVTFISVESALTTW